MLARLLVARIATSILPFQAGANPYAERAEIALGAKR